MGKYDNKRVVITGGSSGIGLAMARLLVEEGARVLIVGRDAGALDSALGELGERALAVRADVAATEDLEAVAERVKSDLGGLDAVFANAGINGFAPFGTTPEALYDEVMAVNSRGAYFTVQKLAPLIDEGGAIVLTTSVANVHGFPMLSAYAASKAATRSMARSLARELLERKIRVNAVSPGAIDTGALAKVMPADAADHTLADMAAGNPMLRLGEPREVAEAAAFLAFHATYTTGAELPVDGGGSQL